MVEYAGWAWRLSRQRWAQRRSAEVLKGLAQAGRRYFVFPLQLDCDYQLRLHSPFYGLQPAIEQILCSFAAHAPRETVLVVKEHPLDNGLVNWRKRVRTLAGELGIADRVLYLECGDVAPLVQQSAGVVTINSTTGTLALGAGVPVITLGDAVYNLNRITFQGTLDEFWTSPTPPETAVFDAFRRVLVARCLVRGGYFSEPALDMLVRGSMARLEQAVPGRAASAVGMSEREVTRGGLAAAPTYG
jgi:capsular polysaccharide export protein